MRSSKGSWRQPGASSTCCSRTGAQVWRRLSRAAPLSQRCWCRGWCRFRTLCWRCVAGFSTNRTPKVSRLQAHQGCFADPETTALPPAPWRVSCPPSLFNFCPAAGLRLIHDYTTFVGALTLNTYAEHAAAIAADAAAQEAIAGALLTCCLPHLAAKFGEAAAAGLPPSSHQHARKLCVLAQVLQCLPLASGLAQHMQAPGAAGTLRLAADVVAAVAALPRNLPASSDQDSMVADDTYLGMHLCAAGLLAACCSGLSQLPTATAGSSSNGHGGGVDCGGSGGGSSDGSVRGGGGSRSGGSGSGGSAEAGMSGELPMVAWELIAAVPHMCSAVRAVAPCTAAADLSSLGVHAKMFSLYSGCLPWLPAWLAYAPCSATQLAAWAAAAEAGLRLQPVLVQLDAALQQLPDGSPERQAVGRLAGQLMVAVCGPVPAMEASPSGGRAASEPATAAFGSQLLQAHLAGCRLAHRLSQQGAAGRAMETLGNTVGMAPLILTLLISLCQMLMRLFQQEPTGAELNAGCADMLSQWAIG